MNEVAVNYEQEAIKAFWQDPILYMRQIHPDWFPTKMPWFHRGIVALVLQRTDFLLNFGQEVWQDEIAEWTKADLEMIAEHFLHSLNPDDPESKKVPLFYIRRDEGGEPVSVDIVTSRFIEVMLPRGFSKTTLFNALITYKIVFQVGKYTVYLSETATHSEQQLTNVRRELETNERLVALWGILVPDRNDPEKSTANYIECLNGHTLQSLGRGGQVRGKNSRGNRPDTILLDDVEDKESVATPEQRKKTKSWLWGDVLPALPKRRGQVFILGTLLHRESMMMEAARDPEFICVKFGSMLPDGKALEPKFMTEKEWMALRERFKRQGLLDLFYMEHQSTIHVDADSRKFKVETWKFQLMTRAEFVAVAEAIDPAISESVGADACSIGIVGMTTRGFLHVLDMWSKVGASPREQVDEYFRLHFLWDVTFHGVEAVAYQKALVHLLTEEMARKSNEKDPITNQPYGSRAYFEIIPILHGKTGKVQRVEGILAPRYASGYITHQRRFPDLESEAIDWPNGKKDNLDVEAMAISLLDPVATTPTDEEVVDLPRADWEEISDVHVSQCP